MIEKFNDKRDWFFKKKYGLFIHWGLYAIKGFHEQEMYRLNIPRSEYEKYIHEFNPVKFDPEKWLDLAEEAGMQYITITTKHIDGFCLWDTKYTDYNIMNTPYKKDIIAMLAEACHKRDFPLCLYYACADMHHPNYPNQGRPYELLYPEKEDRPNMAKYIEYVKNQLRELCTNYGEISGIFWDANLGAGGVAEHYDPSINHMIRSLQPKAVINERGYDEGDYTTPERDYQKKKLDQLREFTSPKETIESIGMHSWGYKVDEDFYTSKYLMQKIDRMMAMGSNFLLNVGPKADGTIQSEFVKILKEIGNWYKKVEESFVDVEPVSTMIKNEDIMLTKKGNTLYVHLYQDPKGTSIMLDPITVVPKKAILLNNGQELEVKRDQGVRPWKYEMEYLRIRKIPSSDFHNQVMVLKLDFDFLPDKRVSE